MVLHWLNPNLTALGSEEELKILSSARLGTYNVATHPAIAYVAKTRGHKVTYHTQHPQLYQYPGEDRSPMPAEEFREKLGIDHFYLELAKRSGVKHNVTEVTKSFLEQKIDADRPLICMTDNNGALHDVVLNGYDSKHFFFLDPLQGETTYEKDHALNLLRTRYGSSIIEIYD